MPATTIEWTDETWNPVTGCTEISPGCENCYAATTAHRFAGTKAFPRGFEITLRPERLDAPLRWRKPRRVFVNSMSDLFHPGVEEEFIVRVFAVMALTPQHTYQVLTKRHGRMRSLLNRAQFWYRVGREARHLGYAHDERAANYLGGGQNIYDTAEWEKRRQLDNVWLGVSVEDQQRAELRIPALLDTPAAVRFLSCEPLLGPIDLTPWMPPVSPVPPGEAPASWQEWTWPDWVPQTVRDQIEDFWGDKQGRTPRQWLQNMHENGAHPFGATITAGDGFGPNPPQTSGRYVHAWNNIGRLVHDDGSFTYTSFGRRSVREQRRLHWVIAGGESSAKARPMHPDWARSLRDQCEAARVPFFFKQWGAYRPGGDPATPASWVDRAGKPGPCSGGAKEQVPMVRVGKSRAGRELDGREWNEYPPAPGA